MSEFKGIPQERLKVHFVGAEGKISRRELFKMVLPLGKVTLDGSKCTGCGLCALDCPTKALTFSSSGEADAYQLLFKHGLCVACGRCIEVCPEKCLQLERILEVDRIDSSVVLFEDEIARCRECGSIIGSRAMIERLQVKLLAMGDSLTSQFELCPMCKIGTHLSLGRAARGLANRPG